MITLKTNTLKTRKRVLIDDVEYTVRRMGNIEQLEYQQYMRRLSKLAESEKEAPLGDTEVEEVDEISLKLSDMFISLFDDGGDQSNSRRLIKSLSDSEIGEVMGEIFKEENEAQIS